MLCWRWNNGTVIATFTGTAWNLSEIAHRVRLLWDHVLGQVVVYCVTRERAIAQVLSHELWKDCVLILLWIQLNWANKLAGWCNASKWISSKSWISIWFVVKVPLTVYPCWIQSWFQLSFNPEGSLDLCVPVTLFIDLGDIQLERCK